MTGPLPSDRGFGALLQTQVERVDLGEHHGHRIEARVEHRTLRVALGRGAHAWVLLGRRRAVALEVTRAGDGARYDVDVPGVSDPWLRAVRRAAGIWLGAAILLRIAGRFRRRRHGRDVR